MVIGIDLGTTYSVAAFKNSLGEYEVISDGRGYKGIPSVLLQNNGKVLVGNDVLAANVANKENTVRLIKDHMSENKPLVTWKGVDQSPVILSSYIVRKVVEEAAKYIGEEVDAAVVTVPAYFTDAERLATMKAIDRVGIKTIAIINEPTAAALCYINQTKAENEKILVYDLGGGTFDVTILKVEKETDVTVIATQGLKKCGGHYLDDEILELLKAFVVEKHGIDVMRPEYDEDFFKLLGVIEASKKLLSYRNSVDIPYHIGNIEGEYTLTREAFNKLVDKLYKLTERKCKQVLKEAELDKSDIDQVLVVGGSSRIPYVRESLSKFMGREVYTGINPDEAVAIGAAIRANINNQGVDGQIQLKDVCSHSIGISVEINEAGDMENQILIKRNSIIPCKVEKKFAISNDGLNRIVIPVNEGEAKELTDVVRVADAAFDIPSGAKKMQEVTVGLELDASQILHITLSIPALNYREEYLNERSISSGLLREAEISQVSTHKDNDSLDDKIVIQQIKAKTGYDPMESNYLANKKYFFKGVSAKLGLKNENCPQNESLQYLLDELDNMVGCDRVKQEICDQIDAIIIRRQQRAKGIYAETKYTRHMLFLGGPGTGKTTVAKSLAKIYYKLGLIKKPELVTASRADLVGEYIGQSAPKVKEVVEKAMGGILFIDEAYSLVAKDSPKDYGHEVVAELIQYAENLRDDLIIVMAGYEPEMEEFLRTNPGLKSRFNNRLYFDDYNEDELIQIFRQTIESRESVLAADTGLAIRQLIENRSHTPDFGNARGIRNLCEEVQKAKNKRLTNLMGERQDLSEEELLFIINDDILAVLNKQGRERSLDQLRDELNSLTGLKNVKKQIEKIVDKKEMENVRRGMGSYVKDESGIGHMVFLGNPGTGKTTVAKLIGEIYKQLGILPRGEVTISATKDQIVSPYAGGSADLVKEVVTKAMGGVLFLDEAYSICSGPSDTRGHEAVDALIKYMEDNRNDFLLIMAGYTKEMDEFMQSNPGFKSRIENVIVFEDYTADEMIQIYENLAKKDGKVLEEGYKDVLLESFERATKYPTFANARGVRNVFKKSKEYQDMRLIRKGIHNLTQAEVDLLTREDMKNGAEEVLSGYER